MGNSKGRWRGRGGLHRGLKVFQKVVLMGGSTGKFRSEFRRPPSLLETTFLQPYLKLFFNFFFKASLRNPLRKPSSSPRRSNEPLLAHPSSARRSDEAPLRPFILLHPSPDPLEAPVEALFEPPHLLRSPPLRSPPSSPRRERPRKFPLRTPLVRTKV